MQCAFSRTLTQIIYYDGGRLQLKNPRPFEFTIYRISSVYFIKCCPTTWTVQPLSIWLIIAQLRPGVGEANNNLFSTIVCNLWSICWTWRLCDARVIALAIFILDKSILSRKVHIPHLLLLPKMTGNDAKFSNNRCFEWDANASICNVCFGSIWASAVFTAYMWIVMLQWLSNNGKTTSETMDNKRQCYAIWCQWNDKIINCKWECVLVIIARVLCPWCTPTFSLADGDTCIPVCVF